MNAKLLLLSALIAPAIQAEPFISEYVEGSGNNKAIEIYNPAATPLDLTGYSLQVYSNGKTTVSKTIDLKGTVAAKGVLVLVDTAAVADLKAKQSSTTLTLGTGNFNGNDVVALYKGNTLIDVIGRIGEDPGKGWINGDVQTLDKTLVRKPEVTAGDTNGNDAFDPAVQWLSYENNTFTYLGSHSAAGGGNPDPEPTPDPDPEPTPDPVIGQCGAPATFISRIQGAGDVSAEVGKTHVVEGVVTLQLPTASGFYLQEEDTDADLDANTSEAIFVYNNGVTGYPEPGQKIRVMGVVEEFFTKTQLKRSTAWVDCGQGPAVSSVALQLPLASNNLLESLENMQVHFDQTLTVSDTFKLGRYGELTLSADRLYIPTNLYRPGSAEALALAAKNSLNRIVLDDKQNGQNPAVVPFPAPGLSMDNPVRMGDQVQNLRGVLDYSFSAWRLMPAVTPQFIQTNPRQEAPELRREGSLKVASFNVLNYFNGNGTGGGFPTSRGATTAAEFERQADKIVAALSAMNADVIGLMEIENDGFGSTSAITDLVGRLNAQAGENRYAFAQVAGSNRIGSDEITVGLLYNRLTVAPVGAAATTNSGIFATGNRQPLAQSFRELANNEVFSVVVNHFKSKGSCPTGGQDADKGDGQSCWNATRVQAATQLMSWLAGNPTGQTDPDVLVIGDLNSYAKEDPIHTFTSNGFVDLVEKYHGKQGYGYSFNGEAGYLDHALASASLSAQVVEAIEWHINSDEPISFDYNVEFKTQQQQTDYYQANAYRSSDHDPVIVALALAAANPADLDKDGDVDSQDVSLFNTLLRSGQSLSLSYDFNKDGKVSSLDARAMSALCTYARCAVK